MMQEHPIQGLMKTAMENIKEMVDVNTIIGDPVEAPDGSLIIPVSRVSFGFAAGGSEFESGDEPEKKAKKEEGSVLPFGGGSGGGVTVQPVGFLIVGSSGQVRMLPVDRHAMFERLMDMAPQLINQVQSLIRNNGGQNTQGETTNYQI
jgi:sporulation protein YtfJ